jgi:type IV secretion system protein VirB1
MLTVAALMAYAHSCNLSLPPETLAWRVRGHAAVESSRDPLAIRDNTANRSYRPATRDEAIGIAAQLLAARHSLDGGVMQVNSQHWSRLRLLPLDRLFDPRLNICAGLQVVAENYDIERRVSCRYNTGKPICANGYPEDVARAGHAPEASSPPSSSSDKPATIRAYGDDEPSALAPLLLKERKD